MVDADSTEELLMERNVDYLGGYMESLLDLCCASKIVVHGITEFVQMQQLVGI